MCSYACAVTQFDWSILKKPRWILAAIVGVAIAVLFVQLAVWQLDRLDERRTTNAIVEARAGDPPVPLEDLIVQQNMNVDDMVYRAVIVEGTYRATDEFFSLGRVSGSVQGTLIVTPLDLADGSVLIVVRGIVPPSTEGPPAEGFETPEGVVRLVGRIDDGEEPAPIGELDPADGKLTSINRLDLEFIRRWVDGSVAPFTLILEYQDPPGQGREPIRLVQEELTEGSHLGYAVQWVAFALIVFFGVAGLIYKAGTTEGST